MISAVIKRHFVKSAIFVEKQIGEKAIRFERHSVRTFSTKFGQNFRGEKKKDEKILENEKYMTTRFEHFQQSSKNESIETLYPHKFESSCTVEQFVKKFDHLKPSESLKNEIVKLTGRIFSVRLSGKKLRFLDLHQARIL